MRNRSVILMLACLLLLCGSTFAGLKPDNHTGFFIGLGAGGGSLTADFGDGIESDPETGGVGNFYLGLALSQNILLGIDGTAWSKKVEDDFYDTDATWTFANAALCLWIYPAHYFYLKGGPAVARAELELDAGNYSVSGSQDGFGFTAGAGGELRLTDKFAIIPQASFMYQSFDDDFFEVTTTTFAVTIGVAWYW